MENSSYRALKQLDRMKPPEKPADKPAAKAGKKEKEGVYDGPITIYWLDPETGLPVPAPGFDEHGPSPTVRAPKADPRPTRFEIEWLFCPADPC
jgi:hypothetical protein